MAQFILLLRGGHETHANYTPQEMQEVIEKYGAWAASLRDHGKLVATEKLKDRNAKLLRAQNGQIVVDGPFAETKETIGGYFKIGVADEAEAIRIAENCPIFAGGGSVELREIEI